MVNKLSSSRIHRLDIQGFDYVDQDKLAEVGSWLRLAFLLCATLAALGTITASPVILMILFPIALLGAIFPVHPFDLIYNLGIRRITGTTQLPKRGAPSRFACGLGSVWLLGTAWLFYSGLTTAGYILGGLLTSVAVLVGTTDICIPSIIFRSIFGKPKPRKDVTEQSDTET